MTLFRFVSQETAKLGRSDARWQANNDYRVNCEDRIIVASRDLRNSVWNRAWPRSAPWTAKLTSSSKLKEWYNLHAAVRPTPKVGRLSVASLGDGDEDGAAARDEGEEGRIWV